MSIPLGKLGFYLPRTLSRTVNSPTGDAAPPFRVGSRVNALFTGRRSRRNSTGDLSTSATEASPTSSRPIFRIGGSVIPSVPLTSPNTVDERSTVGVVMPSVSLMSPGSVERSTVEPRTGSGSGSGFRGSLEPEGVGQSGLSSRTIRFPDEVRLGSG